MRRSQLGSWLLGPVDQSTIALRIRVQLLLTGLLVSTNVIGSVVVVLLITLVIPGPDVFVAELALVNFVVVPAYVLLALVVGGVWGTKRALRALRWVYEDREPNERERRATLRVPLLLFRVQAVLWTIGTVLFTTIFAIAAPPAVFKVAFTAGFAGIVVCANAYLLSEFALRPVSARALSRGRAPNRKLVVGVTLRTMLGWGLGTGSRSPASCWSPSTRWPGATPPRRSSR